MSRLKFNFQAKVLIPVAGVLVLFFVATMWLLSLRMQNQLRSEATESLMTAQEVFRKSLSIRAQNLEAQINPLCNQPNFMPMFKKVVQLNDEKTLQDYLRDMLDSVTSDAKAALFTTGDGKLFAATNVHSTINLRLLHAASVPSIDKALKEAQPEVDVVQSGSGLFNVVSVPVFGPPPQHEVLGVLTMAMDLGEAIADFKLDPHSQLVFIANDHIIKSTLGDAENDSKLLSFYIDMLNRRGEAADAQFPKEHYVGVAGRFPQLGGNGNAGYLLLASYDFNWAEFQQTRQLLIIIGSFGALIGAVLVWLIVRRATQPLRDLRNSAEAVSRGDFSQRIEISTTDEFGELSKSFNHMTENLQRSISELEQTVEKLKTTQAQLVQSEKLSAIGEFVAGIAHELNNPLTSVIGFTELLKSSDVSDQTRASLRHISSSAERCQKIVKSLLSFARQHAPERKPVNVNAIVDAVIEILAYELRTSNIKVTTDLDPNLPGAIGDMHQLQQVFLNMVNNARQAIESHRASGNIHITSHAEGDVIRVRFLDDGPGISPENLKKLFTPFFTTKPVGKGTGLGLSVSYGMIKEHGGNISVDSIHGKSTTFTIELPAAKGSELPAAVEAPKIQMPHPQTAAEGTGRKILIVDDETSILELVTIALQMHGYEVETLSDGKAALEKLERTRYDLTVLDFKMPGMGGQEVYKHLLRSNPDAARRVLFMTGDVLGEKTEKYLKEHGTLCVSKPFSLETFRTMVKKSLDQSKN
jgi:two-component system, NtrC family, sensor kinase